MSAGEIGQAFDMTGTTISYYLSHLKKSGLIGETKYKNYIYYELNASVFEEVMLWISQFGGDNNKNKTKLQTPYTQFVCLSPMNLGFALYGRLPVPHSSFRALMRKQSKKYQPYF